MHVFPTIPKIFFVSSKHDSYHVPFICNKVAKQDCFEMHKISKTSNLYFERRNMSGWACVQCCYGWRRYKHNTHTTLVSVSLVTQHALYPCVPTCPSVPALPLTLQQSAIIPQVPQINDLKLHKLCIILDFLV